MKGGEAMSNFRFGDDYRLNYYPQEASDGWDGVDWDKVESVEIECDVYVKERTCKPVEEYLDNYSDLTVTVCSNCRVAIDDLEDCYYCPNCGAKVVDE